MSDLHPGDRVDEWIHLEEARGCFFREWQTMHSLIMEFGKWRDSVLSNDFLPPDAMEDLVLMSSSLFRTHHVMNNYVVWIFNSLFKGLSDQAKEKMAMWELSVTKEALQS
jgi:hypothetical protein